MKIAVLGSGAGGTAVAFDWSAHGHEVFLFDIDRFPVNVRHIAETGGIEAEGKLEGKVPVAWAGHDIETAMKGADIVFLVGPAFATRPMAAACAPYLESGQEVIVCPGSTGGALAFKDEAAQTFSMLVMHMYGCGPLPTIIHGKYLTTRGLIYFTQAL